jgi:hypothetical protein
MALKHPLLFTSWQSIACHCAWMFIRSPVKISDLKKLARFVCSEVNWLWVTHSLGGFTVEATPSKRTDVIYSCQVCRWNSSGHF